MNEETLCVMARDFFDHAGGIDAATIPIDATVREMCAQNACGQYGKSWTCPPAIDSLDKLKIKLAAFKRFLVVYKVYALEDSFDWEGMVESARDFQSRILKFKKRAATLAVGAPHLVLGAGACKLCDTCSYLEDQPCKHPEDALYSLEAHGIDVMKMMAENGLTYNNGANTVTYVGGVFWTP